jgi:hypothetical protein
VYKLAIWYILLTGTVDLILQSWLNILLEKLNFDGCWKENGVLGNCFFLN